MKSVDFLDPFVKLGRPHVELGGEVSVHIDLSGDCCGESSDEELPGLGDLLESESSGRCLCTKLSGEHSMDLLDSIRFNTDRVGDEPMKVVEVDL